MIISSFLLYIIITHETKLHLFYMMVHTFSKFYDEREKMSDSDYNKLIIYFSLKTQGMVFTFHSTC